MFENLKLEEYLLVESSRFGYRFDHLDPTRFKYLYEKNCKEHSKIEKVDPSDNPFRLFRGSHSYYKVDFAKGKTTDNIRASKTGFSFYSIIQDYFLPEWEKFPKRLKSLICSSDYWETQNYVENHTEVVEVIPYDNTKIAICYKQDNFYVDTEISKEYLFLNNLNNFNQFMFNLIFKLYPIGYFSSFSFDPVRNIKSPDLETISKFLTILDSDIKENYLKFFDEKSLTDEKMMRDVCYNIINDIAAKYNKVEPSNFNYVWKNYIIFLIRMYYENFDKFETNNVFLDIILPQVLGPGSTTLINYNLEELSKFLKQTGRGPSINREVYFEGSYLLRKMKF